MHCRSLWESWCSNTQWKGHNWPYQIGAWDGSRCKNLSTKGCGTDFGYGSLYPRLHLCWSTIAHCRACLHTWHSRHSVTFWTLKTRDIPAPFLSPHWRWHVPINKSGPYGNSSNSQLSENWSFKTILHYSQEILHLIEMKRHQLPWAYNCTPSWFLTGQRFKQLCKSWKPCRPNNFMNHEGLLPQQKWQLKN
jgi:hypothetical protein